MSFLHTAIVTFLICLALVDVVGCGGDTRSVGSRASAVVYGIDDRKDVYVHPNAVLRQRARDSAVALFDSTRIVRYAVDGTWSPAGTTLGFAHNLCPGERYASQISASFCSGTLIDDDLVLTAGHCVTASTCPDVEFVFDYLYASASTLETITDDDVYGCQTVVARRLDPSLDYAIIQLDRPVVGRVPAVVDREYNVETDDGLTAIGFPNGTPAKIADNGRVVDDRSARFDWFMATLDTFGGNSGSGVFADDGTLVGVLVRGNQDYVDNGGCNVVNVLPESTLLAEEVTYAAAAIEGLCNLWSEDQTSVCSTTLPDGGVGPSSGDVGLPDAGRRTAVPAGDEVSCPPSAGCSIGAPMGRRDGTVPYALLAAIALAFSVRSARRG